MTEEPARGGQEAVVNSDDDLLLVTGGPGTGKTRTALLLARRLLLAEPPGRARRVLFLTFSRSAVSELFERTPALLPRELAYRVEISTFHGFAQSLLEAFGRYAGRGRGPVSVASEAEQNLHVATPGALSYDELVPAATAMLAAAPWIRERVAGRYIAIICDEYQDTGDDQDELLRTLADGRRWISLADPDQMIYDFRADVGPRRLAQLRLLGPREIALEPASHRDPTGVMPALAVALRRRDVRDAVVGAAMIAGRLRVAMVADPWGGAIEEVKALRRAGHQTVGVFVTKREFVEALAREFVDARIRHEIAGLDAAAGEAQAAIAAMARFAVGDDGFEEVRKRAAIFLAAAQPRRNPPPLAIYLLNSPHVLPAPIQRRLAALETQLLAVNGEPVSEFFGLVGGALTIFGWGQPLWRLGARDLFGQALDLARRPLDSRTAEALTRVASRRRADALTSELGSLRMPVRLMTMHQAKGREMDAILIVHHPDDYLPDPQQHGRVMFVAASRARRVVSILVPGTPHALYQPISSLIEF